jgi:hypothetical protein
MAVALSKVFLGDLIRSESGTLLVEDTGPRERQKTVVFAD